MPILQQDNGFGDAIGSLIAGYGLSQRMKSQKQDRERQQQIDAQNSAFQKAQLENEQARTKIEQQNADQSAQEFKQNERRGGINPQSGQPMNFGYTPEQLKKGTSAKNPADLASFYGQMAARAASEGAWDVAAQYSNQSKQVQQQAIAQQSEALKFQEFAEKQMMDAAQRAHLGTMDQTAVGRLGIEAAHLQYEVQHGNMSLQQAQENLQLRLQEFQLNKQKFGLDEQKFKASQNKAPRGRPPIEDQVKAAKAHGITDPQTIGNKLIESGYPLMQVKVAVPGYQQP